jgi:hypothetical protein
MSALQNPIGPQPPPPPKRPTHRTARKWYIESLEFCREVVGLPAVAAFVMDLLQKLLRFNDIYVKAVTALALVVAIALRLGYFPKLRVSTVLLLILGAVLTIILVVFVFPFQAQQDSNSLASSWLEWANSLGKSVGQCKVSANPAAPLPASAADCLATVLVPVVKSRPRPVEESNVTRQAGDLLAGQAIFANYKARALLDSRLSISKQFVGSGYSEPIDVTDLSAARVKEYLVPNDRDVSPHVWFWIIDPTQIVDKKRIVDRKLVQDVLLHRASDNHKGQPDLDFARNWGWVSQHLQLNDSTPALVRFIPMDPKKYSGCLGRPEATRVFMSNLGQLAGLTVAEAARNSGYRGPEKDDDRSLRLLIWVYAPEREDQAVPATWGNVLANFEAWITAKPCEIPK